jgi:hypothetical protein
VELTLLTVSLTAKSDENDKPRNLKRAIISSSLCVVLINVDAGQTVSMPHFSTGMRNNQTPGYTFRPLRNGCQVSVTERHLPVAVLTPETECFLFKKDWKI